MPRPATSAIQESREALGLSQRELADAAGVDHTYLSRYERGQVTPTRRWVRTVATAIGRRVAARYRGDAS